MKNHIMKQILNAAIVMTLLVAITQTASARAAFAPDAGSTSVLMGMACAGLIAVRRFIKR
jgi:diacylglycerol kinase